jgi:hypothetical protein
VTRVSRMALLALLSLVLSVAGCKKSASDEAGAADGDAGVLGDRSKSLTPEEVGQGMQLCRGYVARLCRCVELHKDDAALADECDLAKSQPTGLEMTVKFLSGKEGPISTRERLESEAGARKIIAACVRADAKLDPTKCPR